MNTTLHFPTAADIPALRELWIQAFSDPDFWDAFLHNVYSSDHCRCLFLEDQLTAALFWFDCEYNHQKIAYIYAVATDERFQHRGLCRTLMADTHQILAAADYDSAMLVPAGGDLPAMYGKMGYHYCTRVTEFTCEARSDAGTNVSSSGTGLPSLQIVQAEEYAELRRQLLPAASVIQEGANLANLQNMATLWAGDHILLASYILEETLYVQEFLGDPALAPAITESLGARAAKFRMPGSGEDFAMIHPLKEEAAEPEYFGLAFD